MKILLGISRAVVGENGTYQLQRSEDVWEVNIPDDGSEFPSSIWMIADGLELPWLRARATCGPLPAAAATRAAGSNVADLPHSVGA